MAEDGNKLSLEISNTIQQHSIQSQRRVKALQELLDHSEEHENLHCSFLVQQSQLEVMKSNLESMEQISKYSERIHACGCRFLEKRD